jgi:hypothetical protein
MSSSCSATGSSSNEVNPAIRKIDISNAYTSPFYFNIGIIGLFLGALFVKHINSFKINM